MIIPRVEKLNGNKIIKKVVRISYLPLALIYGSTNNCIILEKDDYLYHRLRTIFIFTEVSKEVEEAITSDEFVISMKDIRQVPSRKRKNEMLFSLDFPGLHQKFSIQLDRENKRGT